MTETRDLLRAPLEIGFDYTRSLGPVLSRFFTALAGRQILGVRAADWTVHAPPFEYDPVTHQPPEEFIVVGPEGTVLTWSWMPEPLAGQPLDRPFAWALIRLDGADTAMLHAVDAGSPDAIQTGLRVRPRWAPEPKGSIRDIEAFEPVESQVTNVPPGGTEGVRVSGAGAATEVSGVEGGELVTMTTAPIQLHYQHTASPGETIYLRGLAEAKLLAQRCPVCGKVYIPARGTCPVDGVPMTDVIELPQTGTVTTFCIVNVPYPGQQVKPPYVAAAVLLDGADISFQQLILGCDPDQVRMGMRVRAVWRPEAERTTSAYAISHFTPSDEPDAAYESYARHL